MRERHCENKNLSNDEKQLIKNASFNIKQFTKANAIRDFGTDAQKKLLRVEQDGINKKMKLTTLLRV